MLPGPLAVAAPAAPALLRPEPTPSGAVPIPHAAGAQRRTLPRIWFLAVLAFMLMLCEGVANDWSVLHLKDVLGAPAATAALAYGAVAAAAGLTLAALSPTIPLALIGWTIFGAGLSGCIPQLFSAAGHTDPDAAGVNVSRVAGLGYLGMLAGPAVIGPMTRLIPLNLAFFLPVTFCVIAGFIAPILKTDPAPTAEDKSKDPHRQHAGR